MNEEYNEIGERDQAEEHNETGGRDQPFQDQCVSNLHVGMTLMLSMSDKSVHSTTDKSFEIVY